MDSSKADSASRRMAGSSPPGSRHAPADLHPARGLRRPRARRCRAARAQRLVLASARSQRQGGGSLENVLKVAPENAEALAALGGFAARSGRLDEARSYLARLLKANPKHPEVAVLQREVTLGPRFGPMLIAARKLVREGKEPQGAPENVGVFGGGGAPPALPRGGTPRVARGSPG